jgi:hypothetical protein
MLGVLSQIVSWAGEVIDRVRDHPELQRVLVGVGAVTATIFVVGIVKHAIRSAIIGGVLSAAAWFWYFSVG